MTPSCKQTDFDWVSKQCQIVCVQNKHDRAVKSMPLLCSIIMQFVILLLLLLVNSIYLFDLVKCIFYLILNLMHTIYLLLLNHVQFCCNFLFLKINLFYFEFLD